MTEQRRRCQALTHDGNPCKNYSQSSSTYCHIHRAQGVSPKPEVEELMAGVPSGRVQTPYSIVGRHLMKNEFTYLGKSVKIAMNEAGNAAKLTIDDQEFDVMLHTAGKPEDNYIKLWMCEDSYSMTESPEMMAKNIIEYWHQYT